MTYGELLIPGKSENEVLFVCHICHPSLCNDNLSGIAIATILASYLNTLTLNYSYRFLFIPATIGAITWLSRNENRLHKIKHGMVLSLLGDKSPFQFKKSREEETSVNKIMNYLLKTEYCGKMVEFSPYGYDERQFCSPGFNLPVGRLSRNSFGEFPEYHTSADNLDFVKPDGLQESFELLTRFVTIVDGNKTWINQNPKGEPQLGKFGLYKTTGGESVQKDYQMALLWILNLSDGKNSIIDIAERSGLKIDVLLQASQNLYEVGLLKETSSS
ncbi:DUF4910 domain-containing protein [uncultured Draconibacterium sp.]|uniref:DUF4910 domain-containing protein n=1 Tax=uncultured Draconibacterium sp. TaxID=1573823 RepID=UPI002AA6BFCF